jgi:hypothetical protein
MLPIRFAPHSAPPFLPGDPAMRTLNRTLLAGAIALALSTPAVAQFTNAYFFGDSLSDAGSYKPFCRRAQCTTTRGRSG